MKLSVADNVIFESVDDNVVLLSLDNGTYYKLSGTGPRIWELIQELGDLNEVEGVLSAEFNADASLIKKDVAVLVADLEAHGLVTTDARNA